MVAFAANAIARPRPRLLGRRSRITVASVAMSCGITAVMSMLFNGHVRSDMIATGVVCALVIDRIINKVTGHYRRKLAIANQTLEHRVLERTAALAEANQALRDAAEQQRSLRDELMVRDRMATAGMLAAGVSHEIRSPLSVIRIAIDELGEVLGEAASAEELVRSSGAIVADISDATDRIHTILRDLSSIARPVDDPISAVDLSAIVDSATRLAAYKLDRGVRLERGTNEIPSVLGNASSLVQLVLNLVINAARATRSDAPNVIRIATRATATDVILAISDTGTGMSAETKARMFEPFFTTGGDRGGTGLGLTICRAIVERMAGSIAIESELGIGTTVEVTLPRAEC